MTRAGESKFFYSRFSLDGVVCTALQGSLSPEGLLYFYEARARVGSSSEWRATLARRLERQRSPITADRRATLPPCVTTARRPPARRNRLQVPAAYPGEVQRLSREARAFAVKGISSEPTAKRSQ